METVVRNARVTILGQQLMSSKRMNQSIMRRTAFHLHKGTKEDIISKRVVFRWLPVAFSTDVEHGSIWYLWGSMLSVFIPVVPLISLYQKFWHNGYHNIPLPAYVATYCLLIFVGIAYSIGSWLFARSSRVPTPPPVCADWYHIATDELHGMWWFFWGTVPGIPICAIYVHYTGFFTEFGLGLAGSCASVLVMAGAVNACYPREQAIQMTNFAAMLARTFCKEDHWIHVHVKNDWVVATWMFLYMSIVVAIMSLVMAINMGERHDEPEIFNYSMSFVDMVIFTVGSMYLVAGSYGENHDKEYERFNNLESGVYDHNGDVNQNGRGDGANRGENREHGQVHEVPRQNFGTVGKDGDGESDAAGKDIPESRTREGTGANAEEAMSRKSPRVGASSKVVPQEFANSTPVPISNTSSKVAPIEAMLPPADQWVVQEVELDKNESASSSQKHPASTGGKDRSLKENESRIASRADAGSFSPGRNSVAQPNSSLTETKTDSDRHLILKKQSSATQVLNTGGAGGGAGASIGSSTAGLEQAVQGYRLEDVESVHGDA